jgi:hypothetical protein
MGRDAESDVPLDEPRSSTHRRPSSNATVARRNIRQSDRSNASEDARGTRVGTRATRVLARVVADVVEFSSALVRTRTTTIILTLVLVWADVLVPVPVQVRYQQYRFDTHEEQGEMKYQVAMMK